MDSTSQILATGGTSGIVGVVLFLLYRLLSSRHKIRSSCCGRVVEVETNSNTPPRAPSENIPVIVDEDNCNTHHTPYVAPRPSRSSSSADKSGVSERPPRAKEAKRRSSGYTPETDSIPFPLPKHLQSTDTPERDVSISVDEVSKPRKESESRKEVES